MKKNTLFAEFLTIIGDQLNILPDKSEENAQNTLSALWHTAAGNQVSPIKAEKLNLPTLSTSQTSVLAELIQSRLSGIPLAHLTERQNFMGLDYILNKGLYIPRKETELLSEVTIALLLKDYATQEKVNVIDLCTGIGTIALAIAHYCKNTIVFGSDIYEPAIEAANNNAKHFGLEKLVTFYHADMFDPFEFLTLKNKTDIIVSAPPYVSTIKVGQMAKEISNHEPTEAFDAGPYGLSIFNKLISTAPEYLCNNGYLIFECGLGQGEFLAKRISSNKDYSEVTKICDKHGNIRVLKARKIG